MIYVTGDLHGDFSRFAQVRRAGIRKRDTLLVCGDFGFLWDGSRQEQKLLAKIGKFPFFILFIDGFHENHALLRQVPVEPFAGGKAHHISGNLYGLCRGEVYTVEGKKIFAFGGGDSTEGLEQLSDPPLFLPSADELQNASNNLTAAGDRVDLVVTHDAPLRLKGFLDEDYDQQNYLHGFLEDICSTVSFSRWFIGKYHQDRIIPPHYRMVFHDVVRVED